MKHTAAILLLTASAVPALAASDVFLSFDDPAVYFTSALGRQVNIRFSDAFTAKHLPHADYDAVVLSGLDGDKACFFGGEAGLDPADPKLADVARIEGNDICVPRNAVAVRASGETVAGQPSRPFYATDQKLCSWSWQTGAGVGLWTEDCTFDNGRWNVAYDKTQDFFGLHVDNGELYPVLRHFRVDPAKGLDALLPDLKRRGLVLDSPDCVFMKSEEQWGAPGWTMWQVMPVGKVKAAFEALPKDEVPEPPCGQTGYAVDSIGFFMTHADHPDRVLYVNLGQDGTMIDPFSVQLF
ncbi:MAG: hypothetical protein U1F47_15605 [Hyphomicrobiales bacterium]